MDTFCRLLVPLDGSRLAEAVLPVTTVLAGRLKASVILLHVLERDAPQTVHGQAHLQDAKEAGSYLEQTLARLRSEGLAAEAHVHPNPQRDVAESITQHAEESGADLIVLATHGFGGMRDIFLGTIAQQVLNKGGAPVLLVKPDRAGLAPHFEARRLLVPLDGSRAHDEAVLPVAEALARELKAHLDLLMVVPTLQTLPAERSASAVFLPAAARRALDLEAEEAGERLERLATALGTGGLSVAGRVARGDPADSVPEAARIARTDLIILSTHGRVGWAAFWAGSVGTRIARRIEQPLLLLRVLRSEEA